MKYIIELEDEPMIANSFHQEVDELWKAKGFNSLVFDQNGIKKLTPYTEPDREAIEDEVWEFCMNTDWSWISEVGTKPLKKYSYQEAKAKYEAWMQEHEIKVGDEVKGKNFAWPYKGVVVDVDDDYLDLLELDAVGLHVGSYKRDCKKHGKDQADEIRRRMR